MGVSEMQLKPLSMSGYERPGCLSELPIFGYASACLAQQTDIPTFTQGCCLLSHVHNLSLAFSC